MTLVIAILVSVFILSCFASTKKLLAILALISLFYIHLPIAIGFTLILAVIFFYV